MSTFKTSILVIYCLYSTLNSLAQDQPNPPGKEPQSKPIRSIEFIRYDSNFIFLSAIRSVAGQTPSKEFFDLNLKFNYLRQCFTLLSLDLNLAPADSGQLTIYEGLATANRFFMLKADHNPEDLNRVLFAGVGVKIFNQLPYVGAHVGSLEIAGPLFSSYFLLGYYRNVYGRSAKVASDNAINFRDNLYMEFTLAFDNANKKKLQIAGILSDIRIKIGAVMPFTNSKDDLIKPQAKDIQYRVVLEVPLGGILKF